MPKYILRKGPVPKKNPCGPDGAGLAEQAVVRSAHAAALESVIHLTNDYIAVNHGRSNMFATLFFGVLDARTGALLYVNCGNEAPLIVGEGGVIQALGPQRAHGGHAAGHGF